MKIYVGNLPFSSTEEEVRKLFEEYGEIASLNLVNDRYTGRFRGFGFIEMDDEPAQAAIKGLDGQDMDGRPLRVNEARSREARGGDRQ
jgi:RNA recognition motif-containing protein